VMGSEFFNGRGVIVTNSEFGRAVFGELLTDEYLYASYFATNPTTARNREWAGQPVTEFRDYPDQNSYYSVSSFRGTSKERMRRCSQTISRLHVVVLDDAGAVPGFMPTYVLQTSTKDGKPNCQTGYVLREPIADLGIAKRLHQQLAKAGHIPNDKSGNNPVRWVRQPVGSNTKYAPACPHVMLEWNPEQKVSLDELTTALGLDQDYILYGGNTDSKTNEKASLNISTWNPGPLPNYLKKNVKGKNCNLCDNFPDKTLVEGALNAISPDVEYDKWVKVVFGMRSLCWSDGYDLTLAWSKRFIRKAFSQRAFDGVWNGYDGSRPDATGIGSVFKMAREQGWSPRTPTSPPQHKGPVILRSAADITPEPIVWLWEGWLAQGKLGILAGPPGYAKTTIAITVAATVTSGGRWPDGSRASTGRVLIWSGEDDVNDTLVPRLMAAGADLTKVHFIEGWSDGETRRAFDPATDADDLDEAIAALGGQVKLVIVDPIVNAVRGDSNGSSDVRRSLQPLVDMAMRRGCAVLGITHFSKGTAGRDPVERVTGSIAFGALARVVLAVGKMPDDQGGHRFLTIAKSNLGSDTGAFSYYVDVTEPAPGIPATRVTWGKALSGSARDLLEQSETATTSEERHTLEGAKEFLREELKNGPVQSKVIIKTGKGEGFSERTLKRAKLALGGTSQKDGMTGAWSWELPKGAT